MGRLLWIAAALFPLRIMIMGCPNCFHAVGEHHLCRQHGGGDCWSAGAYKLKPRVRDFPPLEAIDDYSHPWYAFVDGPMWDRGQIRFVEIIP